MKKLLIIVVGLCLVLSLAVGAAAVANKGSSLRGPAASAGQTVARDHWCNFVLAGKKATADGSVMMGYNNDWSANNYQYLQVVPAPDASKYRFVKILTMGGIQEGGINEYQLSANYGTATDLDKAVLAADPYVKKGYGGEMWDLILQQCRTADEALDLLTQMAVTKGFSGGAAGLDVLAPLFATAAAPTASDSTRQSPTTMNSSLFMVSSPFRAKSQRSPCTCCVGPSGHSPPLRRDRGMSCPRRSTAGRCGGARVPRWVPQRGP